MDRRTFLKRLQWIGYSLLVGPSTSLALGTHAGTTEPALPAIDQSPSENSFRITLIGTGGLGGRMVAEMARSGLINSIDGIEFDYIAVDTDRRSLNSLDAAGLRKVWIPGYRGASGSCIEPETARKLMERHAPAMFGSENHPASDRTPLSFNGVAMTIVIAGMGRGAGTGLGQVIARHARNAGTFTAAFVGMPFSWETGSSDINAELDLLTDATDLAMVIPRDQSDDDALMVKVLRSAEQELQRRVRLLVGSVAGDSTMTGFDLEDLRSVFHTRGIAGCGSWTSKVAEDPFDPLGLSSEAALEAIQQLPQRDSARAALAIFSVGEKFAMEQLRCCMRTIQAWLPADAHIAYVAMEDASMPDDLFSLDVWLPGAGIVQIPNASL